MAGLIGLRRLSLRRVFAIASCLALACLALGLIGARTAHAVTTIIVSTTQDADDPTPNDATCDTNLPGSPCSLRAAIETANFVGGATIPLPAGTYALRPCPPSPPCPVDTMTISKPTAIVGAGTDRTIVDGGGHAGSVFALSPQGPDTMSGFTIRNGDGVPTGGAIDSNVDLTLSNMALTQNKASFGGAINLSVAHLVIDGSTLAGNTALGQGGGIFATDSFITVTRSTISGNTAAQLGGGMAVLVSGTVNVTGSTFSGNSVTDTAGDPAANRQGFGGAIFNDGDALTLTNDTLSGNIAPAGRGAAIFQTSHAGLSTSTLDFVTIAANSAHLDGGVVNDAGSFGLHNTIVATNTGGNCSGTLVSAGYNVSSGHDCPFAGTGDQLNTDPKLGPLADNGGPTQTMALEAGSTAIDAADPRCDQATDQRGVTRPQGPRCDIGAFELVPTTPTSPPPSTPTPVPSPPPTGARTNVPARGWLPIGGLLIVLCGATVIGFRALLRRRTAG